MKTIMVVDDEEPIRRALYELLDQTGYSVLDASDGQSAMHLIQEHTVDLVITDIMMPQRDGIELIRWIKASRPDVKIIAVSGGGRYSALEFLTAAKLLGAHRTFTKPISPCELLVAVQDLLSTTDL